MCAFSHFNAVMEVLCGGDVFSEQTDSTQRPRCTLGVPFHVLYMEAHAPAQVLR